VQPEARQSWQDPTPSGDFRFREHLLAATTIKPDKGTKGWSGNTEGVKGEVCAERCMVPGGPDAWNTECHKESNEGMEECIDHIFILYHNSR